MIRRSQSDTDHRGLMLVCAIILPLCMLFARAGCVAHAQDKSQGRAGRVHVQRNDPSVAGHSPLVTGTLSGSDRAGEGLTTTLVRACVAETDWAATDCAGVLHVLQRRADRAGVSIEAMTMRYVSAFKLKKPTPRLRWVLQIESACNEPEAWPSNLDWSQYAQRCREMFDRVRAFEAGELEDPCKGKAEHFGGPTLAPDADRAARAGWRRVRCGEVATAFYAFGGGAVDAREAAGQ